MTTPPPDWAIQVPSAPVQRPPAKAFQVTQQSTQQVQALQEQLMQSVWQAFLQIVDGFLNLDMSPSDQLATWAQDVAAAGAFITTLLEELGIPDQTAIGLVTWLQTELNQLGAALQQSWMSFQQLIQGVVQDVDADVAALVAYLNGVGTAASKAFKLIQDFLATGDWSDLTAAWTDLLQGIFGSSTQLGLLGLIPAPAVVNVTQNLQPVFDFPDAASVSAGAQWSWDGTVDHTGAAGSGSAKVVADGVLQALKGTPGAVSPGQVVTPSAWIMWSGLTATGSPIQLQLIPYSTSGSELVAGTPFEVAQVTSPAASHAWMELTGTYTVPTSGVSAVQLRLVVTETATAGTVWWDDCQANVSGGFLADLNADTNDIIDSFAPGGTAAEFQTGVTNLLALFGLTPADIGGATVIDTVWTDVVNTIVNPLNALEVQATNIIGQIEQSAINGLATTLSALLGTTTFQSLLDAVANVLGHSGTGHSISDIETYLGIIPPANVTNVLGGANLGADVSSVHTNISTQGGWLGRLLTDVTILFDVFHITYTSTQWNTAWTDLMALVGLTNSTTAPSNPTPTIGTAINNNTSTLNTTNTNLFGSTTPGTAIQTSAVPSGIAATKISNVLGGANLGADVTSVHTTATNGTSWATRLTNDLAILLDVFHLTYTSTQWNTAWTDLMALLGIVNSTSTPTNPTPTIGTAITTAQSTASSASSAASTAQSGAQATADGIHQAINNDTSTGTSLTASAVKSNLQTIPHVNIQQGVFARVARVTTSSGPTWTSGQIPTSTYDSVVVSNSNVSLVSGRSFQVALAGTYFFNFSFVASITASPDIVQPQFYINGSLARTYPTQYIPIGVSSGLFGYGAVIELGASDTITPAFLHTGNWQVVNDTTGSFQNSMEIALLTRS